MSTSPVFDTVRTELEQFANMDAWAARGALQLSLMDAGIEASQVTASQMKVVVDRLLPKQLASQKVADIRAVCERIHQALALLADAPATDSPERVFQRLAS